MIVPPIWFSMEITQMRILKNKYFIYSITASGSYITWKYLHFSASHHGFVASMEMSLFYPPNAQRNYYQAFPMSNEEYNLYPHQYYKIWFSGNSNIFLPDTNQQRLIECRKNNPNDIITLIYSWQLLSFLTILKLYYFCYTYKMIPKNFDTATSDDPTEKRLISYAREEMIHNKCGGNLAAASDIVRVLRWTKQSGFYSDFDVTINTLGMPDVIPIKKPVVYNFDLKSGEYNNNVLYIANFDSREVKAIQTMMADRCEAARKGNILEIMPDESVQTLRRDLPTCCMFNSAHTQENANQLFVLRSEITAGIQSGNPKLRTPFTSTVCHVTGPAVMQNALTEYQNSFFAAKQYSLQHYTSTAETDFINPEHKNDLSWVPTGNTTPGQEYGRI